MGPTTATMGMLLPQEAQELNAIANGGPGFDVKSYPYETSENVQSYLPSCFLLDTLVGSQCLWDGGYSGPAIYSDTLCIVIVVNALSVPLKLSGNVLFNTNNLGETLGEQWVSPSGVDLDPSTGGLTTQPTANTVPAADKDGGMGYAIWAFCNSHQNGAVNFGMTFQVPIPNYSPSTLSLAVKLWAADENSLFMDASADPQALTNTAYYDETYPAIANTTVPSPLNGTPDPTYGSWMASGRLQAIDSTQNHVLVVSVGAPVTIAYTVGDGDTLRGIAQRYGITLEVLEAANPQITNPDVIGDGEVIGIPSQNPYNITTEYSVVSGDTLAGIAQRYGMTLATLEAANPQITNPNVIGDGMVIHVPGQVFSSVNQFVPPTAVPA